MSQNYPQPQSEDKNNSLISKAQSKPFILTINVAEDGLDACKDFLASQQPDLPICYVLFAAHGVKVDALHEQVSTKSNIPVEILEQTCTASVGKLFIVPASMYVQLESQHLTIVKEADLDVSPIETFLTSVTSVVKKHTIAVFFTHWISHCLEALKLIRENKGLILHHAQSSPVTSLEPRAPYLSHLIDGSLPLHLISERVRTYVSSSKDARAASLSFQQSDIQALETIHHELKAATGVTYSDFDLIYVMQHLHQRLQVFGLQNLESYAAFLTNTPQEASLLARRIILKRASFFHEMKAMQLISQEVIPGLIDNKGSSDIIRAWVPSCASGEEAFSLAILLQDYKTTFGKAPNIQVIATDADETLLQYAKQANYAKSTIRNIPEEFTGRYFELKSGQYQLKSDLLNQIHFSQLDPVAMPPYAKLHLIYARGYIPRLKKDLQQKVFKNLNRALDPSGFLVIGEKEFKGAEIPHFLPADDSGLIYRPIVQSRQDRLESSKGSKVTLFRVNEAYKVPPEPAPQKEPVVPAPNPQPEEVPVASIGDLHRDLLIELQAPVSIVINPDFSILNQIGNVSSYILWPNNGRTANILTAFPEAIRDDLREAVVQALKQNKNLQTKALSPEIKGIVQPFKLHIRPLNLPSLGDDLVQIMFIEPDLTSVSMPAIYKGQSFKTVVGKLEADLRHAKDRLNKLSRLLQEARKHNGDANLKNATIRGGIPTEPLERLQHQNTELRATNKELLALNRDLVKRVEEMRNKMRKQVPVAPPPVQVAAPAQEDNLPAIVHQELIHFMSRRHEVRTALTSIMGFADLLTERLYDLDNKELARYIGKAGHRLSDSLSSLLEQEMDSFEVFQPEPPASEPEEVLNANGRLLVVEDSDATRRLLSLVLSDRFDCEVASDASEAIEKAEKELFKAVLLDINLGSGKSGVDVLEYLKQNRRYDKVPFMAVTAMASPNDESMLLRRGFDAYLAKPFQKAKLLNTLDAMLAQKNTV